MMKNYKFIAPLVGMIAVSFAFVGFQCSSAELTSAKMYIQKNEWDKAESELEKDVAGDSLDAEGWYYLGIVRGQKGNYPGLVDAFDHTHKISPAHDKDIAQVKQHFWVIAYNDGSKNLERGRDTASYYDSAATSFRGAVILEPDSLIGYRGLAYTYLNKGDADSAIAPLMVLWDKAKDQDAAKFLGEIYFDKGRKLRQAFQDQNGDKIRAAEGLETIKQGISKFDATNAIGQPDEKTTKEPPKVKAKRGKKAPEAPVQDIWVYKKYGVTLVFEDDTLHSKQVDFVYNPQIDSSKYDSAIVQFKNALNILKPASRMYPDDSNIMTILTNCYVDADMTQEAAEAFKVGAEKNPGNKDFQYNYGVILLKSNDYAGAISQFEKALKIDPEYLNALYNIGASYVNWGVQIQANAPQNSDPDSLRKAVSAKFKLALPYLEKYSSYKSDEPNIWELLGKVYAFLNEPQKAQDAIQKADALRQTH